MPDKEILNEDLKDDEYVGMCEKYTDYIDEHVKNVQEAFKKLFRDPEKPFTNFHGIKGEKLERLLGKLEMAVNCHDSSKYLDEEFEGYRTKFYPTYKESVRAEHDQFYKELIESNFNVAWFHHFTTNDHHPNFWKWVDEIEVEIPDLASAVEGQPTPMKKEKRNVILKTPKEVARPMKPLAILHMICDWEAMSIKFHSSTPDWYITKAVDERKAMNPKTRVIVEELLAQLYSVEIPKSCAGDPGYTDDK